MSNLLVHKSSGAVRWVKLSSSLDTDNAL